jgi:hypothetical protein
VDGQRHHVGPHRLLGVAVEVSKSFFFFPMMLRRRAAVVRVEVSVLWTMPVTMPVKF